jgi:hypothetical protein
MGIGAFSELVSNCKLIEAVRYFSINLCSGRIILMLNV